jgi:hypothetical protein
MYTPPPRHRRRTPAALASLPFQVPRDQFPHLSKKHTHVQNNTQGKQWDMRNCRSGTHSAWAGGGTATAPSHTNQGCLPMRRSTPRPTNNTQLTAGCRPTRRPTSE